MNYEQQIAELELLREKKLRTTDFMKMRRQLVMIDTRLANLRGLAAAASNQLPLMDTQSTPDPIIGVESEGSF
jgi:hypothetical protein